MPVEAVLWDYDGTLAWTLPQLLAGFREAFRVGLGETLSDDAIVDKFGPSEEVMIARAVPPERVSRALAAFYETFRREQARVEAPSPLLSWVKQQSGRIPMAIVSNKGRVASAIALYGLGLAVHLPIVVTADDVSRPKPDPEGLWMAASRLGVDPGKCVYIGDAPSDVKAAQAAGMGSLWVAYGHIHRTLPQGVRPDVMIQTPEALMAWLTEYVIPSPQSHRTRGCSLL